MPSNDDNIIYLIDEGVGGATTLAELQDTNIVNPVEGQILYFDGVRWINKTNEQPTE